MATRTGILTAIFDGKGLREHAGRISLDAGTLKIIAMISMTIDHIAGSMFGYRLTQMTSCDITNILSVMRLIGRLAFPIYAFFIVEGFFLTHSRRKYLSRMLIFSLISEIPFDLCFSGKLTLEYQNVGITFSIALMMLILIHWVREHSNTSLTWIAASLPIMLSFGSLAYATKCDYDIKGIALIYVLYLLRDERFAQTLVGACTLMWEPTSMFAFPLLYCYNGKKGNLPKRLFYWFYPVHMLVLWILSVI